MNKKQKIKKLKLDLFYADLLNGILIAKIKHLQSKPIKELTDISKLSLN